jgi:hypothetical protein
MRRRTVPGPVSSPVARIARARGLAIAIAIALAIAIAGEAATAAAAAAATGLEQISPADGFPGIEFKHLAMNGNGQFVAVSQSAIYVGDVTQGKIARVFASDRVAFVLSEGYSHDAHGARHLLQLDWLGTRVAINEMGEYVAASHTAIFVGRAGGGEPRKVFEDGRVMFLRVALNDSGHFVAVSRLGLVVGETAAATATRLLDDAAGSFAAHGVGARDGHWGIEVGQTHLALNARGQFVATSGRAAYAGSVPARTITKLHEDPRVGFRHVALSASGSFVVLSVKNAFRGALDGGRVTRLDPAAAR